MSKESPSFAAKTETLRELYAALNRNDIQVMIESFDPQIEWIDPVESPMSGTYRGREVVERHFSEARAMWAEGSCEPVQFVAAGEKVIVFVDVRARLKHESEWREGPLADVYTFRDGKVIQGRSFSDRRRALEWAGVDDADASS